MNNVFVLLEFEKEMKLLSEAEKSEGKILYIKETKTEDEENKARKLDMMIQKVSRNGMKK